MSEFSTESKSQPIVNEHYFEAQVERIGALFGLSGLSINIKPGSGWSCGVEDDRITITVDPLQLAREQNSPLSSTLVEIDKRHIIHTAIHELSHAVDIIDRTPMPKPTTASSAFFWNAVHDTVIDTRARNIPLLDQASDSLYDDVLFPEQDLRDLPKHVQLMEAILLSSAVPRLPYLFNEDIVTLLTGLKNHLLPGGRTVDIINAMTNLQTPLKSRIMIAQKYILPLYKNLEFEDQQQSQQQSEKDSDGASDLEAHYEAYEITMHGTHQHSNQDPDKNNEPEQGDSEDKNESGQPGRPEKGDSNVAGNSQGDGEGDEAQQAMSSIQRVEMLVSALKEVAENQESKSAANTARVKLPPQANHESLETLSHLAGTIQAELELSRSDSTEYAKILINYRHVIAQSADVLLQLSALTNSNVSPRFKPRASQNGRRLHPSRLTEASIQSITRQPRSVWQPVDRLAARPEREFGGLDIHLIIDVSQSMTGKSAQNAAITAIILLEAIDLARYTSQRDSQQFQTPDVRTQVVAFGSDHKILAPLKYETTSQEKASVFYNLSNPHSGSTLVNSALKQVAITAKEDPSRDQVVVIVTDGAFGDHALAVKTVDSMPDNIEVTQLNINFEPEQGSITTNDKVLRKPEELPKQLFFVLQHYIENMS